MTPRQEAAQAAYLIAHENHRIAMRGDRERTMLKLCKAANEVLMADVEARTERKKVPA